LAADYFQGISTHTTSPGVRVGVLDPNTILDTATNPPVLVVDAPSAGRTYRIYDPGVALSNFVLNPGGGGNILDCTATGLTCYRTATTWLEGGKCQATTSSSQWSMMSQSSNSTTTKCLVGTHQIKGIVAFPAAVTFIQSQNASCAASLTCALTYPATTVAGNLLEVEIAVDGSKTVSTVSDGTNSYTKAVSKTQGALDVEIWYVASTSTAKNAGTTLTVTYSGGTPNSVIHWKEYAGVVTGDSLDRTTSSSNSGSTAVSTGTTVGTAQNNELVLGVVGAVGVATITGEDGWTPHGQVNDNTDVSLMSQGLIQQATSTQVSTFTLGSSEPWAAVIATFKANVDSTNVAQAAHTWQLPSTYTAALRGIDSGWYWMTPTAPLGTANVNLGAQVVCTASGATDDPDFLALNSTAVAVPTTALKVTKTDLTSLTATGCAANSILHLQLLRQRYDSTDTYEGYVYLLGAPLVYGSN